MMDNLFNLLNADGDVITTAVGHYKSDSVTRFIGKTIDGQVVVSLADATPIPTTDEVAEDRRQERIEVFAQTIDRMNPIWYNSLTTQQQTDLAAWRQDWLDFPSTGTRPDDLDIFSA